MALENDFSISPMGGEAVPYQDLNSDTSSQVGNTGQVQNPKPKTNKVLMLIIAGLGFIVLVILIILIYVLQTLKHNKPNSTMPVATPIATTTPKVATSSANTVNIQEKIDNISKQLDKIDLQQTDLSYPQLDWNIKY